MVAAPGNLPLALREASDEPGKSVGIRVYGASAPHPIGDADGDHREAVERESLEKGQEERQGRRTEVNPASARFPPIAR